jgi:indolepyruvate ferredoxin oxidoreductase beta subunit
MAQRGGFVKAQLRLGREAVGASIPEKGADLIIATEVSETLKAVRFIKPSVPHEGRPSVPHEGRPGGDGVGYNVILFGFVWAPTAVMLGKAPYPSLEQVTEQIRAADGQLHYIAPDRLPIYDGAPVPDNIYVLGAALAQTRLCQLFDVSDVAGIVRNRWKRGAERNLFALEVGVRGETRRDVAGHQHDPA